MIALGRPEIWQSAVHSTSAWIFTFTLAVVFPILDYVLYPRLKSTMQIYIWNILALWSLAVACVWTSATNHLAFSDLGEQPGNPFRTLVVCGVVAAIVLLLFAIQKAQKKKASPEQLEKALKNVKRLLPTNPTERAVWVFVSITAGFCEEILYRGWLLSLFGAALGSVWWGLLISSILFGFAHAYQGRNAIFGTGVLGAVFGVMFIGSGSLIPGQLLHTAMDLNNGLAFGRIAKRATTSPSS
ncbi:MAG: type II CAAX endopeptidase family protein [Candidatus Acidiferrales bacterium]|jgi:membrane protease YdiL (CAAX protease family)